MWLALVGKSFHWKDFCSSQLPNEDSILRLIGVVRFEHNDDWQSQHRSRMVEAFSQIDTAQIDPLPSITTQAA